MKAIHGGKAKNDRIDSHKIAKLMRGGNFPLAYTYPKTMRATRDLFRRRTKIVRHDVISSRMSRILLASTTCRLTA